MNLSSDLWYVKWFFWSCRVLDRFWLPKHRRAYGRAERYADGTNLCQFFRVLFAAVLIYLLTITTYLFVLYTFFINPFFLFPALSVFKTVLVFGTITALVALCVYGGTFLMQQLGQVAARRASRPKPMDRPRFGAVFMHYYRAIKHEICPMISFGQAKENPDV